jgi:uridine kinase
MVHAESAAIVEGIFILRPELVSYYALRFWVECPKEIRLHRGIERDGEQARSQWEDDWMKEEEKYIDACHPQLLADKIMYGG